MAKKAVKKKIEKEVNNANKEMEKEVRNFFIWLIGIVVLIAIIFIIIQSSNEFTYNEMDFLKHKEGNIVYYTAKIPVQDIYGNEIDYFGVDFRNDPRKLEDISVNLNNDAILFIRSNKTYVSYNIPICEDNTLAGAGLGLVLAHLNLDYKGALDDIAYINSTQIPYVNCKTHPKNTVIYIINGTETRIDQTAENCYQITFKDCEILPAVEKFEVELLEQYIGFKS